MNDAPQSAPGRAVDPHLLVLNSGSSSLKFGLYAMGKGELRCRLSGAAELVGTASGFTAQDHADPARLQERIAMTDARAALARIDRYLVERQAPSPAAIGHRIVHGGPQLLAPVIVNESVLRQLDAAAEFAPLHNPAALQLIRDAAVQFPGRPQVVCFDTHFHAGLPAVAATLPLPQTLRAGGIRRYGFHGLSCESIVHQLGAALPARLLIAHLGNGASVTAVLKGRSIDTSMGLTPAGGLIMGSRSGDLDPGLLVHLMRAQQLDATQLEDLLNHRSGLLGISGLSSDMRALHAVAQTRPAAKLAIAMFCYAAAKQLGAMSVALGGVDGIVFTGGIGEHDAVVRRRICAPLAGLGVELDPRRNRRGRGRVSRDGSGCPVQVLPSQEDEQIARHTRALCRAQAPSRLPPPQ